MCITVEYLFLSRWEIKRNFDGNAGACGRRRGYDSYACGSIFADLDCKVAGTALFLRDAVEKARSFPIDVAILDINLAGELSYPAAEVLQARGIPFVFATGYSVADVPIGLRAAPMLAKPFQRDELATALRNAMDSC